MIKTGVSVVSGYFGAGKSCFLASITMKALQNENAIVFTNIKMKVEKPNLKYYEDKILIDYDQKTKKPIIQAGTLDIFRYSYKLYKAQRNPDGTLKVPRHKLIQIYLIVDEAGIIYNSRDFGNLDAQHQDFLYQVRKLQIRLIFCAQAPETLDKQFRRMVERDYYYARHFISRIYPKIGIVRKRKIDEDGKPMMEYYEGRDERGDMVMKQRLIDYYHSRIYKPRRWKYYDDLHINIINDDTTTYADYGTISDYIRSYLDRVQNVAINAGFYINKIKKSLSTQKNND